MDRVAPVVEDPLEIACDQDAVCDRAELPVRHPVENGVTNQRTVGPLLRTPEEGADTIVWLAAAPDAVGLSGLFFLDRRARAKHRLRRTRRPDEAREAAGLWRLCAERTAPFSADADGSTL